MLVGGLFSFVTCTGLVPMTIPNVLELAAPALSSTWMANENSPGWVGVPLSRPDELRVSSGGSVFGVDQEYGGVPPETGKTETDPNW